MLSITRAKLHGESRVDFVKDDGVLLGIGIDDKWFDNLFGSFMSLLDRDGSLNSIGVMKSLEKLVKLEIVENSQYENVMTLPKDDRKNKITKLPEYKREPKKF